MDCIQINFFLLKYGKLNLIINRNILKTDSENWEGDMLKYRSQTQSEWKSNLVKRSEWLHDQKMKIWKSNQEGKNNPPNQQFFGKYKKDFTKPPLSDEERMKRNMLKKINLEKAKAVQTSRMRNSNVTEKIRDLNQIIQLCNKAYSKGEMIGRTKNITKVQFLDDQELKVMNCNIRKGLRLKLSKVIDYMNENSIHVAVLTECGKWEIEMLNFYTQDWSFFFSELDYKDKRQVLILTHNSFIDAKLTTRWFDFGVTINIKYRSENNINFDDGRTIKRNADQELYVHGVYWKPQTQENEEVQMEDIIYQRKRNKKIFIENMKNFAESGKVNLLLGDVNKDGNELIGDYLEGCGFQEHNINPTYFQNRMNIEMGHNPDIFKSTGVDECRFVLAENLKGQNNLDHFPQVMILKSVKPFSDLRQVNRNETLNIWKNPQLIKTIMKGSFPIQSTTKLLTNIIEMERKRNRNFIKIDKMQDIARSWKLQKEYRQQQVLENELSQQRSKQMYNDLKFKIKNTEKRMNTIMKDGEALNGVTGRPVDGWELEDGKILRGEEFENKLVEENSKKFNTLSNLYNQEIFKKNGIRKLDNNQSNIEDQIEDLSACFNKHTQSKYLEQQYEIELDKLLRNHKDEVAWQKLQGIKNRIESQKVNYPNFFNTQVRFCMHKPNKDYEAHFNFIPKYNRVLQEIIKLRNANIEVPKYQNIWDFLNEEANSILEKTETADEWRKILEEEYYKMDGKKAIGVDRIPAAIKDFLYFQTVCKYNCGQWQHSLEINKNFQNSKLIHHNILQGCEHSKQHVIQKEDLKYWLAHYKEGNGKEMSLTHNWKKLVGKEIRIKNIKEKLENEHFKQQQEIKHADIFLEDDFIIGEIGKVIAQRYQVLQVLDIIPIEAQVVRQASLSKRNNMSVVTKIKEIRPIGITNIFIKLIEKTIQVWMDRACPEFFQMEAEQAGSSKGKSTLENVIQITDILLEQENKNPNTEQVIANLDMSAAFDSVKHNEFITSALKRIEQFMIKDINMVWSKRKEQWKQNNIEDEQDEIIRNIGWNIEKNCRKKPNKLLIHLLVNQLINAHSSQMTVILRRIHVCSQGVTQGSAMAPNWFKVRLEDVYMNDQLLKGKVLTLREIRKRWQNDGVFHRFLNLCILQGYVDDLIVIFESLKEFQDWISDYDIQSWWKSRGIQLNRDKTEIMIVKENLKIPLEQFKLEMKNPELQKQNKVIRKLKFGEGEMEIEIPVVKFTKYLGMPLTVGREQQKILIVQTLETKSKGITNQIRTLRYKFSLIYLQNYLDAYIRYYFTPFIINGTLELEFFLEFYYRKARQIFQTHNTIPRVVMDKIVNVSNLIEWIALQARKIDYKWKISNIQNLHQQIDTVKQKYFLKQSLDEVKYAKGLRWKENLIIKNEENNQWNNFILLDKYRINQSFMNIQVEKIHLKCNGCNRCYDQNIDNDFLEKNFEYNWKQFKILHIFTDGSTKIYKNIKQNKIFCAAGFTAMQPNINVMVSIEPLDTYEDEPDNYLAELTAIVAAQRWIKRECELRKSQSELFKRNGNVFHFHTDNQAAVEIINRILELKDRIAISHWRNIMNTVARKEVVEEIVDLVKSMEQQYFCKFIFEHISAHRITTEIVIPQLGEIDRYEKAMGNVRADQIAQISRNGIKKHPDIKQPRREELLESHLCRICNIQIKEMEKENLQEWILEIKKNSDRNQHWKQQEQSPLKLFDSMEQLYIREQEQMEEEKYFLVKEIAKQWWNELRKSNPNKYRLKWQVNEDCQNEKQSKFMESTKETIILQILKEEEMERIVKEWKWENSQMYIQPDQKEKVQNIVGDLLKINKKTIKVQKWQVMIDQIQSERSLISQDVVSQREIDYWKDNKDYIEVFNPSANVKLKQIVIEESSRNLWLGMMQLVQNQSMKLIEQNIWEVSQNKSRSYRLGKLHEEYKNIKALETSHGFDHDTHCICEDCEKYGTVIRLSMNHQYLCRLFKKRLDEKEKDISTLVYALANLLKYANIQNSNEILLIKQQFTDLVKKNVKVMKKIGRMEKIKEETQCFDQLKDYKKQISANEIFQKNEWNHIQNNLNLLKRRCPILNAWKTNREKARVCQMIIEEFNQILTSEKEKLLNVGVANRYKRRLMEYANHLWEARNIGNQILKTDYLTKNNLMEMWEDQKKEKFEMESFKQAQILEPEEKEDLKLMMYQYPGYLEIISMEEDLQIKLEILKEEERNIEYKKVKQRARSRNMPKREYQSHTIVKSRSSNKSMKSNISFKSEEKSDRLRGRVQSRLNMLQRQNSQLNRQVEDNQSDLRMSDITDPVVKEEDSMNDDLRLELMNEKFRKMEEAFKQLEEKQQDEEMKQNPEADQIQENGPAEEIVEELEWVRINGRNIQRRRRLSKEEIQKQRAIKKELEEFQRNQQQQNEIQAISQIQYYSEDTISSNQQQFQTEADQMGITSKKRLKMVKEERGEAGHSSDPQAEHDHQNKRRKYQ